MGIIKELAKKLIDENPPEEAKDYDVEKLKRLAKIKEAFKSKVDVDVFVCFTPLCKIECEHFTTFFDKHGHGNSQGCINHGGILDDLEEGRFPDGKIPVGCPHFPQEIMKKNRRMLDFHQAYGVLCYKYTGRYEGAYQGLYILEEKVK